MTFDEGCGYRRSFIDLISGFLRAEAHLMRCSTNCVRQYLAVLEGVNEALKRR